jgi:3-deoxy-7-phosphoheptulonate synthase
MVVVGPCSVHDVDAALDYAGRLAAVAERHAEDLLVVMRVYFEKPRTSIGWKGLINDPHLDGTGDVNAGLRVARALLLQILDTGLPIGCEFLDPITPQYISDAVAWGAIGARTTESQIHRQLAPGSRCRSASRTAPTATSRWRSTRSAPPPPRTPSPASTTAASRRSTTRPATPMAT